MSHEVMLFYLTAIFIFDAFVSTVNISGYSFVKVNVVQLLYFLK